MPESNRQALTAAERGWLAGWLVGWLAGWLVGWLAGWLRCGRPWVEAAAVGPTGSPSAATWTAKLVMGKPNFYPGRTNQPGREPPQENWLVADAALWPHIVKA
jgi:hypothetical protein